LSFCYLSSAALSSSSPTLQPIKQEDDTLSSAPKLQVDAQASRPRRYPLRARRSESANPEADQAEVQAIKEEEAQHLTRHCPGGHSVLVQISGGCNTVVCRQSHGSKKSWLYFCSICEEEMKNTQENCVRCGTVMGESLQKKMMESKQKAMRKQADKTTVDLTSDSD